MEKNEGEKIAWELCSLDHQRLQDQSEHSEAVLCEIRQMGEGAYLKFFTDL